MNLILKSAREIKSEDKVALRKLFREMRGFFDTDKEFREFLKQIEMDNTIPMKDIENKPQTKLTVQCEEFGDAHDVLHANPKTETGSPQTKPKKQMKEGPV